MLTHQIACVEDLKDLRYCLARSGVSQASLCNGGHHDHASVMYRPFSSSCFKYTAASSAVKPASCLRTCWNAWSTSFVILLADPHTKMTAPCTDEQSSNWYSSPNLAPLSVQLKRLQLACIVCHLEECISFIAGHSLTVIDQ